MKRFGLLTLLFSTALLARPESLPHQYWQPHLDATGRTDGYRRGVGLALFTPICESECSLLFAQGGWGRWYDTWSGSLGLGFRRLDTWAWGVNGFVDYSRSGHGHGYLQLGVGAELLADCWEARINGYTPFSSQRRLPDHCTSEVVTEQLELGLQLSHDQSVWQRWESAYRGFDFELGAGMPLTCNSSGWAYIGYKQFHSSRDRSVIGPRLRLELRLDNFLGLCGAQGILGGSYEYDGLFGNEVAAELGIRIPLTGPARSNRDNPSCLYRRMGNRVIRAESVLVHRHDERCAQQVTPIGQALFISPTGAKGAVGSQEKPAPIGTDGSDFDLLLLVGEKGKLDSTLVLQEGQQLLALGKSLEAKIGDVKWKISGKGDPITLTAPEGGAAVQLAPGARIEGIRVETPKGGRAFVGEGAHGVTLRDLQIAGQGDGIQLKNSSDVSLENIQLLKAQKGIELLGNVTGTAKKVQCRDVDAGLTLTGAVGAVEVTEFGFSKPGATPIRVRGGSPELKVSGQVSGSTSHLLDVEGMKGGDVLFTHTAIGTRPVLKDEVWTPQGVYGLQSNGGLRVKNSAGSVELVGAAMNGTDLDALSEVVLVEGGSAQVRISNSKFVDSGVQGSDNLTLESCLFEKSRNLDREEPFVSPQVRLIGCTLPEKSEVGEDKS